MSLFSFFSPEPRRGKGSLRKQNTVRLAIEALEDRAVPTCNVISGYVYHDANNNGVFDAGETPIQNSTLQLQDTGGNVISTATSDATGFYQFETDQTVDPSLHTVTKTVEFPLTQTNFNQSQLLDQFDPSLGELKSVQMTVDGAITSEIKVENGSTVSASTITGTVSGQINLTAPNVSDKLELSQDAGSLNAAAFDGNTDFQGASGGTLGSKTASGSKTITLSGADLQPYIGTGKVNVNATAAASSRADDGSGNVDTRIRSTASAKVTVVYSYQLSNCLKPGDYKIVQSPQPTGYLDGKESMQGQVIPNTVGTDFINVTLANTDLTHNDFGEVKPSSIEGTVFVDRNNDCEQQVGEEGIAGVTVTLTGTTDSGAVTQTTTTDASGHYKFDGLAPGTYTINETQPTTYADGKDCPGSLGGTTTNDQHAAIVIGQDQHGTDYDFGELMPAQISGHVYVDDNDDGLRGPGENPIGNVTLTLTGTDWNNQAVSKTTTTDASGSYQFTGLAPGSYTVNETQPADYLDGKDAVGSLGGTLGNDVLSAIPVKMGDNGINYDFGEKYREVADVGILKQANATVNHVGDLLTYTLTVTNHGNFAAQQVMVTDPLPVGTTFVSMNAPGWDTNAILAENKIVAVLPTLGVGASSSFTVTVKVNGDSLTLTNPADVTSKTPDSNPNNNHSQVTTTVITDTGSQGETLTQAIVPPVASFGDPATRPIEGKQDLFSDSTGSIDPALRSDLIFVDSVYRTLLGEPADPNAELNAVQRLRNGLTRDQFVSEVWNTDIHLGRQIDALYLSMYGRNSTAAERATLTTSLRAGVSELTIAQEMVTAPEYQQLHPNAADAATSMYETLMGQSVDAGTAQWASQQPMGMLAYSMLHADTSTRNYVEQAYRQILKRDATESELQTWSSKLSSDATTPAQFSQWLMSSQEFYQLAQNSAS